MNQILIVAELVIKKALRGKILPALLLLMLPFLVAAWGFEAGNPGFQSGFAVDLGGSLLAVFAAILLVSLASEHFYWADGQNAPWFYLTRIADRTNFIAGKFAGVTAVLFFAMLLGAVVILLALGSSSGIWPLEILSTAFMIFLEISVLGAVLAFLSIICSRILAAGSLLLVYVAGNALETIRITVETSGSKLLTTLVEFLLVFVPDLSLFRFARIAPLQLPEIALVSLYALMMISVYLILAGMFMRRQDL